MRSSTLSHAALMALLFAALAALAALADGARRTLRQQQLREAPLPAQAATLPVPVR